MNYKVENINNNFEDLRWEEFHRDDLYNIPKMHALGFDIEMHYNDKRYGRTTPDNAPQFSVSFSKNNFHIWKGIEFKTGYSIFHTAYIIDNHYRNHKNFYELDEVIEYFNNNKINT